MKGLLGSKISSRVENFAWWNAGDKVGPKGHQWGADGPRPARELCREPLPSNRKDPAICQICTLVTLLCTFVLSHRNPPTAAAVWHPWPL